jgi:hypothetical protein
VNTPTNSSLDLSALDNLTGGALTAATSSERLSRIRDWLASEPALELLQQVFKELSARDKGAAKPVKEKIEELRRSKNQDALADEWAQKANALLTHHKLNVADAMAWARDAAKAGAPLSREPLASLRLTLADLVKHIEDLAHRSQVLREASLLLAQRIEVLSTKSWTEAVESKPTLAADMQRFISEWHALLEDAHWQSVDPKYPVILNEGAQHIQVVWEAFSAALDQTQAAANDAQVPLPGVPAWADQLRVLRGETVKSSAPAVPKPSLDPALQAQAGETVNQLVQTLEAELALGHSKATTAAAAALRQSLKTHAKLLSHEIDTLAQQALTKAGELEGWQRWRADQLRTELVAKAEALLKPAKSASEDASVEQVQETSVETVPVSDAAEVDISESTQPSAEPTAQTQPVVKTKSKSKKPAAASEVTEWIPVVTGRKLQESLRQLREAWKQTDQGGQPNHALWKRFDQACNRAYPFVQAWLEKAKAESQAHRDQRLALLAEVAAWTQAHTGNTDWKKQARELHQFSERWRNSGHLSEKTFAEMQAQWKTAMSLAHAALEQAQQASVSLRRAMIDEAKQLAAAPMLRIDAVKALQQRWQVESQAVALDRKLAQKLWDAFRQPLDEAFQRKTQERGVQAHTLSAHDQAVLDASQRLEKAIAQGDVALIRQAMQHLNQVISGKEAVVPTQEAPSKLQTSPQESVAIASPEQLPEPNLQNQDGASTETLADETQAPIQDANTEETEINVQTTESTPAPVTKTPAPAKKVVAVRGDDRPGQKKTEPTAPGRFGDKPGARRNDRDAPGRRNDRDAPRAREAFADRGPRLGDAAFRAQRNAIEQAENALKKLAMQAHGEILVHLLSAWQHRQPDQLPPVKELGSRVSAAQRQAWVQALQSPASGDASTALLRLEMAAEVNTPADHQQARRNLQLQLLTKRNDPPPAQTWALDTGLVLQSAFEASAAQRLQQVLRVLMRR